jgi:hypothetical protein
VALALVALAAAGCFGVPDRSDASPLDAEALVHYTFDGFDGARLADVSGHGLDASCSAGCPTIEADPEDGSIATFAGAQRLTIDDPQGRLELATATIAVWLRVPDGGGGAVVARPFADAMVDAYALAIDDENSYAELEVDAAWIATSNDSIPPETWTHVAVVWGEDERRIALGGEDRSTDAGRVPRFDDNDVLIGADVNNGEVRYYFTGAIADLRIYDRALTTTELDELVVRGPDDLP